MDNYDMADFRRDKPIYVICLVVQLWCLHAAAAASLVSLNVRGKPAWESTPLDGYPASDALDGDISTFSHTLSGDPHPWWKVDLEGEHCLGSITVKLRKICCDKDRFITAVARAGLSPDITENQPCGSPATRAQSAPGSVNMFLCDTPRMARYVSLDIDASNPETTDPILMLAEVTVEEFAANECPVPKTLNVRGKPAWESTPLDGYPASDALDGDISTFSHTLSGDPHPWWKVDLEGEHCLGSITVKLRKICCDKDRFITAVARAGLSPDITENQPCGSPATRAQSAPGSVNMFLCDTPRMARYVSLDIDASNPETTDPILMLAEVTVEEFAANECPVPKIPTPVPVQANIATANFRLVYKGAMITNAGPLATRSAKSAKRCAASCLKLVECASFDYALETGQCRLYDLDAQDADKIPNQEFGIYGP